MMSAPFDAVLLVAFGGPQGPADVRPFLENVLRGRRVSPERVEEVAHHYERFGGVSPLTQLTLAQAALLEDALRTRGIPVPVRVGMRNWHPFLADTLTAMSRAGMRRAIGVLAAAQRSYSGCLQYKENVRDARAALGKDNLPDIDVLYFGDWHEHPGFIEANADHVRKAVAGLPADVRERARLIFTAHSIPVSMAHRIRTSGSCARRPRRSRVRLAGRTGRSSIRAAADVPAIRGSSRTCASICAGSAPRDSTRPSSAPLASSAITWRCSTISTSKPRRRAAKSA